MSPAQTALDFFSSAFPEFEHHFHLRAYGVSMNWLREKNPDAWAQWAKSGTPAWAEPESGLGSELDVLVSPDGNEVVAATVGENRGVFIRLELTGRREAKGWSYSLIKDSAGDEAEAINAIVDLTQRLEASGWTRHLVADGELIED